MKLHKRIEEEAHQRHHADTREETEQDEKTSHSAEERSAAHMTPALGGPFFVFGPPRRALTIGEARVRIHKFTERHVEGSSSIVHVTSLLDGAIRCH